MAAGETAMVAGAKVGMAVAEAPAVAWEALVAKVGVTGRAP